MYYLNVLLWGELLLLVGSLAINAGDILAPSVVMTAMFTVSTMVAVLNAALWQITYSETTTVVLLLGLGVAFLADALVIFISTLSSSKQKIKNNNTKCTLFGLACKQKGKIYFFFTLGVIGVALFYLSMVQVAGTSITDIWGTLSRYRQIQVGDASIDDKASVVVVFLNRFLRAGSYVSTFVFFYEKELSDSKKDGVKWNRFLVPTCYLICMCILNSSRGELIKLITFAFAANYIGKCRRSNWQQKNGMSYVVKAIKIFIPFVFSFYGLAIIMNRKPKEGIFDYLSSYIGGSIQHINQYICDPSYGLNKIGGNETFAGVQSLLLRLGITNEVSSTHMEFRWLGNVTHGNIYTFFRRPLHDFGLVGMCLFTFAVIFSLSAIYHFVVKKASTAKKRTLGGIFYCYLLPWLSMSSIDQLSVSYFSIGTFVEILFMYVWYVIMYRTVFVMRK